MEADVEWCGSHISGVLVLDLPDFDATEWQLPGQRGDSWLSLNPTSHFVKSDQRYFRSNKNRPLSRQAAKLDVIRSARHRLFRIDASCHIEHAAYASAGRDGR